MPEREETGLRPAGSAALYPACVQPMLSPWQKYSPHFQSALGQSHTLYVGMQKLRGRFSLESPKNSKEQEMGEIGEPDRVVRRERDPVIAPALPIPSPELEPASN